MTEFEKLKDAFRLEPLLESALKESGTGAREFRDTRFIANLEKVLEIPNNIPISQTGLQIMLVNSTRFLVNRARWEADVEKHPEILDEDVDDPIVVLGLPRSGTTKMQRFLGRPQPSGNSRLGHVEPGSLPGRAAG